MMRSEGEATRPARRPLRWLVLGAILTMAAIGYFGELWIFADQIWRSGWIYYLTIPVASLIISLGAAAVAFVATKRIWPTAVAGTLALLACDVAAWIYISYLPFLF